MQQLFYTDSYYTCQVFHYIHTKVYNLNCAQSTNYHGIAMFLLHGFTVRAYHLYVLQTFCGRVQW